jgi:hypothetical protein
MALNGLNNTAEKKKTLNMHCIKNSSLNQQRKINELTVHAVLKMTLHYSLKKKQVFFMHVIHILQ